MSAPIGACQPVKSANHAALVAGLEGLGLRMLVAPASRLSTIHTPLVPSGIDELALRTRLRDSHGIEIMGGLGPLAGKILRIGLMGTGSTRANVLRLLECLEEVLRAQRFEPPGSGVLAAEQRYARA